MSLPRPAPLRKRAQDRGGIFRLLPIIIFVLIISEGFASAPGGTKKNWSRAILGNLAFLGGITAGYWIEAETNRVDWDFSLSWADQKRRIFDLRNLRLDSNNFDVNAVHAVQGTVSYLISRGSGLGPGEAFWIGLASSAAWEYIVEFREMISLNDMIVTPSSGFVLGESLFEMSRYLRRRDAGRVGRILGSVVDPAGWLGRILAAEDGAAATPAWREGAVEARITAGVLAAPPDRKILPEVRLGLSGRISGFRLAGGTSIPDSALDVEIGLFRGGISKMEVVSRVRVWESRSRRNGNEAEKGFRFGLASAVDYGSESLQAGGDEFLVADVLGGTARWTGDFAGISFRFDAGGYGGFSCVRPAALSRFRLGGDLYYSKSTLRRWEYYYALGPSLLFEAAAAGKGWAASARIRHHRFDSIEGLDRFQSSVRRDFDLVDRRTLWSFRLGWPLGNGSVSFFVEAEGAFRWGRMDGVEGSSRRLGFRTGAGFRL